MKSTLLCFVIILISNSALAKDQDFKSSIAELSADLASINRQMKEISKEQQKESTLQNATTPTSSPTQSLPDEDKYAESDDIHKYYDSADSNKHSYSKKVKPPQGIQIDVFPLMYQKVISEMYDLKTKFDNNPYIQITGIEFNMGLVPSVSVSLKFK